MRLLERENALRSLSEYAGQAMAGAGRVLLVAGEAGAGKSSLLEQFEVETPKARWLRAACDGLFTPRPLGPLFDLAEQLGGPLLDAARSGAAREALFSAVLRQVDEPGVLTIVAIEDLHWADEATLDLLRHLGRRLRHATTMVVATYRDDALPAHDPLRLVLGDLASLSGTRRLTVPPLSERAVAALAIGSPVSAAELHRLTGGNAFFVIEVLQNPTSDVPQSARDAVLGRIARLGAGAREPLQAAALLGGTIDPRLLCEVCPSAFHALDAVVAAGVLVADGTSLRFRHELTRLAVEGEVPPHQRGPVHGRILAALRARGCDDDARLAHHADGAADTEGVLLHAPRAARRSAALASHREAAAQFERALRFASGADDRLRAELLDALAQELALVDRWDEAIQARERALELRRTLGDRLREGDAWRRLSRLQSGPEAMANARRALAVLEPIGPTTELAWAWANVAGRHMVAFESESATAAARRAQQLATDLDLPAVLSDALDTEACVAARLGGEWEGRLREALRVALSAGAEADEQAARAYTNFVEIHADAREFSEAERWYVEGASFCDEHDIDTYGRCIRCLKVNRLSRRAGGTTQ